MGLRANAIALWICVSLGVRKAYLEKQVNQKLAKLQKIQEKESEQ
ncbi:hypothetical protein [Argonema antarcticum]|nr:hypothetical protein [Argonema antarcticum]